MQDLFSVLLPFPVICLFLPLIFYFFFNFTLILRAKMMENRCINRYLLPSLSSPNTGVCPGLTTSRENYKTHAKLLQTAQELPQFALSTSKRSTSEKAEKRWISFIISIKGRTHLHNFRHLKRRCAVESTHVGWLNAQWRVMIYFSLK